MAGREAAEAMQAKRQAPAGSPVQRRAGSMAPVRDTPLARLAESIRTSQVMQARAAALRASFGTALDPPAPVQRAPAPNRTGLPDRLKGGIEAMSGLPMDDVRVHRNSPKPAQLQAHAFAQGTQIHLAPGQERHLPHEAWHVVQQKQGRVRATHQFKGIGLNDDEGLEREADERGRAASQRSPTARHAQLHTSRGAVAQLTSIGEAKESFNSQQDAGVEKADLARSITDIVSRMASSGTLQGLPMLRERLDVLISIFFEGLVDGSAPSEGEEELWSLHDKIVQLRLTAEAAFNMLIASKDSDDTTAYESEAAGSLSERWLAIVGEAKDEKADLESKEPSAPYWQSVITRSWKKGKREATNLPGNAEDTSIDLRSRKLAQVISKSGFHPALIIGLPTAGAQIGARLAGYLRSESLPFGPALLLLRPRFVKSSDPTKAAEGGKLPSLGVQQGMIAEHLRKVSGSGRPIPILIVDDFTKSGDSLRFAKETVEAALADVSLPGNIKTAVSRYQAPSLKLNIIDFVVGRYDSGPRDAVQNLYFDGEGRYLDDAAEAAQTDQLERGFNEKGLAALSLAEAPLEDPRGPPAALPPRVEDHEPASAAPWYKRVLDFIVPY